MLGTLCARSKPWIITALSFTHGAAFNRFTINQTSFLGIRRGSEIYQRNHSTSCRIENKCVGTASIWHAIFPSFREHRNHNLVHPFHHEHKGEGSWNVAWDVRPARWLHSSDSAWLLFGVCACLAPLDSCGENFEVNKCIDESFLANSRCLEDILIPTDETTGLKYRVIDEDCQDQVGNNFRDIAGVTGDGRCLFRAVSYGACMKSGEEPDENRQMELADDLRARVVNELLKRRQETEWSIEGDFDMYVNSIQRPNAWGGEPELLMASHVLRVPISVYMIDRSLGDLVNIAKYGHEYGKEESPIQVLFHGYGHYDVLEIFEDNLPAEVKVQ